MEFIRAQAEQQAKAQPREALWTRRLHAEAEEWRPDLASLGLGGDQLDDEATRQISETFDRIAAQAKDQVNSILEQLKGFIASQQEECKTAADTIRQDAKKRKLADGVADACELGRKKQQVRPMRMLVGAVVDCCCRWW